MDLSGIIKPPYVNVVSIVKGSLSEFSHRLSYVFEVFLGLWSHKGCSNIERKDM